MNIPVRLLEILEYRVYNVLSVGTDLKAILPNFAVRNTTKCRVIIFCKPIKVKEPLFLLFINVFDLILLVGVITLHFVVFLTAKFGRIAFKSVPTLSTL